MKLSQARRVARFPRDVTRPPSSQPRQVKFFDQNPLPLKLEGSISILGQQDDAVTKYVAYLATTLKNETTLPEREIGFCAPTNGDCDISVSAAPGPGIAKPIVLGEASSGSPPRPLYELKVAAANVYGSNQRSYIKIPLVDLHVHDKTNTKRDNTVSVSGDVDPTADSLRYVLGFGEEVGSMDGVKGYQAEYVLNATYDKVEKISTSVGDDKKMLELPIVCPVDRRNVDFDRGVRHHLSSDGTGNSLALLPCGSNNPHSPKCSGRSCSFISITPASPSSPPGEKGFWITRIKRAGGVSGAAARALATTLAPSSPTVGGVGQTLKSPNATTNSTTESSPSTKPTPPAPPPPPPRNENYTDNEFAEIYFPTPGKLTVLAMDVEQHAGDTLKAGFSAHWTDLVKLPVGSVVEVVLGQGALPHGARQFSFATLTWQTDMSTTGTGWTLHFRPWFPVTLMNSGKTGGDYDDLRWSGATGGLRVTPLFNGLSSVSYQQFLPLFDFAAPTMLCDSDKMKCELPETLGQLRYEVVEPNGGPKEGCAQHFAGDLSESQSTWKGSWESHFEFQSGKCGVVQRFDAERGVIVEEVVIAPSAALQNNGPSLNKGGKNWHSAPGHSVPPPSLTCRCEFSPHAATGSHVSIATTSTTTTTQERGAGVSATTGGGLLGIGSGFVVPANATVSDPSVPLLAASMFAYASPVYLQRVDRGRGGGASAPPNTKTVGALPSGVSRFYLEVFGNRGKMLSEGSEGKKISVRKCRAAPTVEGLYTEQDGGLTKGPVYFLQNWCEVGATPNINDNESTAGAPSSLETHTGPVNATHIQRLSVAKFRFLGYTQIYLQCEAVTCAGAGECPICGTNGGAVGGPPAAVVTGGGWTDPPTKIEVRPGDSSFGVEYSWPGSREVGGR